MSISADIQKFDYNEKDGNIYYFIKVFYNGREWAIRKRYSEFVQFNDALRLRYGIIINCSLPAKQYWWYRYSKHDITERRHLKERCKGLQTYLQALLKASRNVITYDNNLLKEFFEVDHNNLQFYRRQSLVDFKALTKMKSFVTVMVDQMIQMPTVKYHLYTNSSNNNYDYCSISMTASPPPPPSLSSSSYTILSSPSIMMVPTSSSISFFSQATTPNNNHCNTHDDIDDTTSSYSFCISPTNINNNDNNKDEASRKSVYSHYISTTTNNKDHRQSLVIATNTTSSRNSCSSSYSSRSHHNHHNHHHHHHHRDDKHSYNNNSSSSNANNNNNLLAIQVKKEAYLKRVDALWGVYSSHIHKSLKSFDYEAGAVLRIPQKRISNIRGDKILASSSSSSPSSSSTRSSAATTMASAVSATTSSSTSAHNSSYRRGGETHVDDIALMATSCHNTIDNEEEEEDCDHDDSNNHDNGNDSNDYNNDNNDNNTGDDCLINVIEPTPQELMDKNHKNSSSSVLILDQLEAFMDQYVLTTIVRDQRSNLELGNIINMEEEYQLIRDLRR